MHSYRDNYWFYNAHGPLIFSIETKKAYFNNRKEKLQYSLALNHDWVKDNTCSINTNGWWQDRLNIYHPFAVLRGHIPSGMHTFSFAHCSDRVKWERILYLTISEPYIQRHNNKLQFFQSSSGDLLHPWKDEEHIRHPSREDSIQLPSASHWIAKEKISAISQNPQYIPGTDCMRYSEVSKQKINLLPGKTRIIVFNNFCFNNDVR